jgi:glycosyltransferase involved in cell wall biosynthesis
MAALFPELSLSAIIPAYNEEPIIESTVNRALESLRRVAGTFELIIVNDASTDRTGELAEQLARLHPELVVLHNEQNQRQGGSLLRGFAKARYDWVTHNGMDYPFDFDDLPALLAFRDEADVIVARRLAYPGTAAWRRWTSEVHRSLIRHTFHVPVKDWGFVQLYRRAVIEEQRVFSRATAFAMPERIVRAYRAGYRVKEVPLEYHERQTGLSSSANRKNIQAALLDMARLWLEFKQDDLWRR